MLTPFRLGPSGRATLESVVDILSSLPGVASGTRQPQAEGYNPVGIEKPGSREGDGPFWFWLRLRVRRWKAALKRAALQALARRITRKGAARHGCSGTCRGLQIYRSFGASEVGQQAALGNGETCLAEGKRCPAVVETMAGRRVTALRNSEGAGRYLKGRISGHGVKTSLTL